MSNPISPSEVNQNSFGLTTRDMKTIQNILKKYPIVKKVNVFGSRAKGNFKKGSDIDLAIMNESVSEDVILKLITDFEESSLPYRVDIVNYPTLTDSTLKEHIDRVGKLIDLSFIIKNNTE